MSFPRYPKYKDSGVEWLGEVPAHWAIARLKDVASVINGYPFDSKRFSPDGAYPLIRIRDLGSTETDTRYGGEFVEAAAVISDDLLIGMDGDFNVGQWFGDGPALLNQRMCCVRTEADDLRTIFRHLLPIPLKTINDLTYATTVKHLSSFDVEKILFALPPDDELSALADFLGRETAKIDAMVADHEKLIALLKEKRQAVISHAVTKGLDPNVPMKDSGIEWLGEVPAHWEVLPLRRVISSIEQGWSPDCFARCAEVEEWGVLKAGCVNRGVFVEAENKALPPELKPEDKYEVRAGDVLMSRASGSPELVGSTALVSSTRPRLMLSDKIFRIHLHATVLPRYFVAVLNSRSMRSQIEIALSGGNGMANNLPQAELLSFNACIPPACVQDEICCLLEKEDARIGRLVSAAERAMELLAERRSALISAAVTGKIDVRQYRAGGIESTQTQEARESR